MLREGSEKVTISVLESDINFQNNEQRDNYKNCLQAPFQLLQ